MIKKRHKIYKKKSGSLIPISLRKDIPFKTKRVFMIYGKKKFIRGDHAHHKCSQYLVPIYGSMIVEHENKFKTSWKLTDKIRLYNLGEISKLKGNQFYKAKIGIEYLF